MTLHPETESYISEVERFARRKFRFRVEMGFLIETTSTPSGQQAFDDLLFFAKFVTNAFNVLKRVGTSGEETVKLSTEFKNGVEKASVLLTGLVKEAPEEINEMFLKKFLSLSHDNMNDLLALLNELSWLKNYLLDEHKPH